MTSNSRVRANEAKAMWDYSTIVEVTIDRPAKDVWPYFFGHYKSAWSLPDNKTYTTIAGQAGQVGEIFAMDNPLSDRGGQLLFEAINVKAQKMIVLKISYTESATSERKLSGYDFVTLNEVAGRTTVVLQQAFELPAEPQSDLNLQAEQQDDMLAGIFQKLKSMVENAEVNR
jgi:hypothetical protein